MTIFHLSEREALNYPLIKGRALAAWHIQSTFPVEIVGLAYLGQEASQNYKLTL